MIKTSWIKDYQVKAMAYDTAEPGYNTFSTTDFRQWRALPILDHQNGSTRDFASLKKEVE